MLGHADIQTTRINMHESDVTTAEHHIPNFSLPPCMTDGTLAKRTWRRGIGNVLYITK